MSSGTSPEQSARHAAVIRAMTEKQRADALRAVDRGVRRLAMAGLRARLPEASVRELVVRIFSRVHGRELTTRVHGWCPEEMDGH
jgi:hypothetical protein